MPDELMNSPLPAAPPGDHPAEPEGQPQELPAKVHVSVEMPEGMRLRVLVEVLPAVQPGLGLAEDPVYSAQAIFTGTEQRSPLETALEFPAGDVRQEASPQPPSSTRKASRGEVLNELKLWAVQTSRALSSSLALTLFALGLFIYLITRIVGLERFPIYFFTDEAIQTVAATDLIHNNLRGADNVFLPTYFKNGQYYNLSLSVYLQVVPYLLFGKSVFLTRLVSVLVTLLAATAVGLMLRDYYRATYWWSGVLILSIAPAWFLHSRTAFETVIFVSLYAGVLYCYLMYRYRSPRYLYHTLVMAALAFYSYSPGQFVIAMTGILLLFSDLRYHWQNRQTVLRGAFLGVGLAIPYLRFRFTNSFEPLEHLRLLGSYWVQPLPLAEKISRLATEYLKGLSPLYWFFPNNHDLQRHLMKDYGHLMPLMLPFCLLGLGKSLWNIRSSAYRLLLIALLAAPSGSALVGIGITRTLVFVIPAVLLIAIGLSLVLDWLEKRIRHWVELGKLPATMQRWSWQSLFAGGLFIILALINFNMLRDALQNGPTWYDNYGLGGMQYGASQLFDSAQDYLKEHPDTKMIISPSWANGTDVIARFFLPDPMPVEMGSIESYLYQSMPLDDNKLFVMIPDELVKARESGKFTDIRIEQVLDYPNGQPGFYFVRLRYVPEIEQILEAERKQRRDLEQGEVMIDGEAVVVRYSVLDMGSINDVFDENLNTVARTLEANPFVIELDLPGDRLLEGVEVKFGSLHGEITVSLYETWDAQPVEYVQPVEGSVDQPSASIDFDSPVRAQYIRLEVLDPYASEPAHIHLWEVILR